MPKSVLHHELDKANTGMDVPTLSLFLRPILTVFYSKAGETGDIYNYSELGSPLYRGGILFPNLDH